MTFALDQDVHHSVLAITPWMHLQYSSWWPLTSRSSRLHHYEDATVLSILAVQLRQLSSDVKLSLGTSSSSQRCHTEWSRDWMCFHCFSVWALWKSTSAACPIGSSGLTWLARICWGVRAVESAASVTVFEFYINFCSLGNFDRLDFIFPCSLALCLFLAFSTMTRRWTCGVLVLFFTSVL